MTRSVIILLLFSSSLAQGAGTETAAVTAVEGESWLTHLHRPLNTTSMGKTWRVGPFPSTTMEGIQAFQAEPEFPLHFAGPAVTVHGGDLYRMNCRGCHDESGLGAPPEIGSVINPIRATSTSLVLERMKGLGMAIGRKQAAELASQSMNALLQRLHNGGQDMPPFPYLREAEVRALVVYLKQLAGVPGAEPGDATIKEPPERVGELIVKSTCHVCHSASGPNPSPQELLAGSIPPLSTLTIRTSQPRLIQKVTKGAPVLMGTPPLPCRGRMPVLYYFSREEAADVYLYLSRYPPHSPTSVALSLATGSGPINIPPRPEVPVVSGVVLVIGFGWVSFLMGSGAWITVREFRRLSAESMARRLPTETDQTSPAVTPMKVRTDSSGPDSETRGWVPLRKKIS